MEDSKDEDNLNSNINPERDDMVIAVDSTGIRVTNREVNGYLTNGRIR